MIFVWLTAVSALHAYGAEETDLRIWQAWWEQDDNGRISARWEKPEGTTRYLVRLYESVGTSREPVGTWHQCVATGYIFTKEIISNGHGTYYFKVYSEKLGEETGIMSDALEVDAEVMRAARASVNQSGAASAAETTKYDKALSKLGPGEAENRTGADRWVQLSDGRWLRQRPDNTLYKNQWLKVGEKTYLFDSSGYMQANGWRSVSGRWYYLGADGALLCSTNSPDGYRLGTDGACLIGGKVYRGSNAPYLVSETGESLSVSLTPISVVSLRGTETAGEEGRPYRLELSGGSWFTVEEVSYSLPYESWKVGSPVTVTVRIGAKTGYYFANAARYTASSSLTLTGNRGDQNTRTLTLRYTPGRQLSMPDGFYMTEDYVLHWDKVPDAYRYRLRVRGDGLYKTLETMKNQADLSEYQDTGASVTVTAAGAPSKKTIKDSKAYSIKNLDELYSSTMIEGTLTKSGNKLIYKDAFGERVSGWRQLRGEWYHFTKGTADGPGWFRDADGYWYYFDEEFRMQTGQITDGGKTYLLNDGSQSGLPLGAWIQK